MNRPFRYGLGALATVVIVAGAALLIADKLLSSADVPAGGTAAYTEFANSANHVKASLTRAGQDGMITLHIGSGWHVNANPASLDNLIPSAVFIEHDGKERSVQADYPAGMSSGIKIGTTDIQVYEDGTRIPVHQLKIGAGERLVVRVQACNDQGICLAPATIPVTVEQA
ncbi:MAG: disulfide bond formation protein DsbD [Castellaniella sp.]|uniref:protein-disulfide reductase DsbD domain-containing protein n=1 Tax=Castellaniella sp. TaxID=1955812 RepID=UPI0012153F86|nr:protein-disulfide reductase DsbD domain-containing protein [Castellaniella sp.]TAN28273.1 MAG: disulfide bond formation protein DsbD [Castellaniella sp.]